MACSICQESYFKAPPKRSRARGSASSAASDAHRLAALGCGHAFHKKCTDAWFGAHIGSAAVLFIDLEEEDYEAGRGGKSSTKNKGKSQRTTHTSENCPCGNAELHQLAWGMVSMNIDNKDRNFYLMCELASRNEELEDINACLQEELDDAYHALDAESSDDDEVGELATELAEQHNLSRQAEESLQEKTESLWLAQEQMSELENKVATLETLALGDRKKEIGEYQRQYGPIY
ncbi:hypothetical protein IWW37_005134 [Coemansia sp. RSA 2050]|nr:hypothetical protein IWW37_005134 [Coemansia sp. RSA 2050]